MHESAKKQIVEYLTEFEGYANWMYLDSIGLVTSGIGVLLDPFEKYGKSIPNWYHKESGAKATEDEIKEEFKLVKSKNLPNGKPAKEFINFRNFAPITKLRAKDAEVRQAVLNIIATKESACRQYFSKYDTFPADVQVVLVQMSYGGGLFYRKDQLAPLLEKRDWLGAMDYTYLTNTTQGLDGYKKYNACFRILMMNAHIAESCSKLNVKNATMPTAITEFYGYKKALSVSRWNSSDDLSTTIYENDIITGGDLTGWLKKQAFKK